MRAGPYKETIKNGIKWLRENQQENGLFGTNASNDFVYGHAIATYAMCEAFGLSNYTLLKKNAQNGINYLEQHRNPYLVWRYQPRDNDNDTSVTGWCVMAYESAKYFKLQVNDQAIKQVLQDLGMIRKEIGERKAILVIYGGKTVDKTLGAVARPARVRFVTALPKTRSGKLLRRAITAICEGRDTGDLTTLEDPAALQQIKDLVAHP